MQVPGPTLIVSEGQAVTITLHNALPAAAGNTSLVFPGFQVTYHGRCKGLLTQEAVNGGTVTYSFTAASPGLGPITAGRRAICRLRWVCTVQSSFCLVRPTRIIRIVRTQTWAR